ncbi:Y-family DNA polymerase [Undibacterium sp. Ji50W]|uniref:Y-family DNA polymerase n=1 Tax=Undibacterium sp. Ji50W TaxID=3413041 RepID=UPI003BF461BA
MLAQRPPLWLAVHLPMLQLEVFVKHWPGVEETMPSAVLQQGRVSAVSKSARQAGVYPGMRTGGAQMLLPDIRCFQRDIQQEQLDLLASATALLQYSPQVALAEDDTILIDISASLSLFGGIRALRKRIQATMQALGLTANTGIAPVARAAWLFARLAAQKKRVGKHVLGLKKLSLHLDRLPVGLLAAAQDSLELLQGIACHSLQDLRQLPRPGLQRRCGKAILHELDAAYGEQIELHQWHSAPPAFKAKVELPDRIEQADALLMYARSLLTQLLGWLTVQHLAVSHIHLELLHERGRQAMPPTLFDLKLGQACWQESHLLSLFKERLTQLKLHSAVIAIVLEVKQTSPRELQSETLFPEPGGKAEDHQRLLELLVARLGENAVLKAQPQADHRPDVANAWVSVMQPVTKKTALAHTGPAASAVTNAAANLRPDWLLPKALALEIRNHHPYYKSELTLISPAERIEAGWWHEQIQARDYFVAIDAKAVRYWIYRERAMDPDSDHAVWFLHGVFG